MIRNKDLVLQVCFFVLGMMLVVYGWRSFFKGLLDIEHNWVRLALGFFAVGLGLLIFYLLFLMKSKRTK
jgi:uncharacterized protein YjeT (DUF2065 family)